MNCQKCGKSISDSGKFCKSCGSKVKKIENNMKNTHKGILVILWLCTALFAIWVIYATRDPKPEDTGFTKGYIEQLVNRSAQTKTEPTPTTQPTQTVTKSTPKSVAPVPVSIASTYTKDMEQRIQKWNDDQKQLNRDIQQQQRDFQQQQQNFQNNLDTQRFLSCFNNGICY